MAGISVPFNGFTFNGTKVLGPQAIAAGRSFMQVSFDMSAFTAGQSITIFVELSEDGGATFPVNTSADFTGPWHDKQGVLQTVGIMNFVLLKDPITGFQPTTGPNAQMRVTIVSTNGPVTVGAGTLQAG